MLEWDEKTKVNGKRGHSSAIFVEC